MLTRTNKAIGRWYALPVLALSVLLAGALLPSTSGFSRVSTVSAAPPLPRVASAVRSLAPLPGDMNIGPAAMNQENPQIAAGGGGYLVVWEDSRTNYAGFPSNALPTDGYASGQTLKDIYAARLDANGQLVDNTPILVAQATFDQSVPQVAWNGQNWLVVWNTERVANFTTTKDIMGARVSPQGVVLDSTPIFINGSPTIDELWPTVASDGTNWLVVWMDQGSYFELDGTRIAPDGVVLDPGGVAVYTPSFPNAPYNTRIAFAGDEYLLTFPVWGAGGDDDIAGLRINTSLQRIGGVFNISTALGYQDNPSVISNGTDFFVAWRDNRDLQTYQVYGARVSHAGQVLDPAGINISNANTGYPYPDVGWDGTQWFVTWVPYSNNTYAARVSTSGQVLDPNGILVSGSSYVSAIVGRPGGGAIAVWTDYRAGGSGNYDIYKASISAGGAVGTAASVSQGAPSQQRARIASNGNGYMLVFTSKVSGENRVKFQRLDASGNAIDPEPVQVAGGSINIGNPSVAWNGSVYLIVWEDTTTGQGYVPGIIYGKRVMPDGTILDSTPINIMPGNTPDVAAMGSVFLVGDTHEATNHFRVVKGVRVDGDTGAVLGSPVTIGGSYSVYARVGVLGNRWLVAWQQHSSHDNPYSSITACFVNSDGSSTTEFMVATATSRTPDIASKGDQAFIVYFNGGEVRGKRMLPDGTLLDGGTGIAVTSAPNAQFFPAAAWTGSEYVVAYEDYRAVLYLDRPVSDVYATRVDSSGIVLDPNGIPLGNDPSPEVLPEVAALDGVSGNYITAFSDFVSAAPYAAYRIAIQSYQASVTPTPQPTRTNTPIPPTPTPICGTNGDYVFAQSIGAAIVPGTTDIGNHCDDCTTTVSLPFPFLLYGHTYNSVLVTSNGTMNFVTTNNTGFINFCLPYSGLNEAIIPHWDDLRTDTGGIFTSMSGNAPNRIFNIEWRASYYNGGTANFEVRLYENSPVQQFDIIYGQMDQAGSGATVGVQRDTGTRYTQFECNAGGLTPGLKLTLTLQLCTPSTATPMPTNTPLPPTATPMPTIAATLRGHVTWQGRPAQPNALQQLPITLTLKLGTSEYSYTGMTTNASGLFTITLANVPNGTYNWRVKDPKYLANSGQVTLTGAPLTNVEMGTMRAGDANNDNVVNITDMNILKATFGKRVGDPGYDDRADFNGDQVVNGSDMNLLKSNFGQSGAPPITPGG